MTTDFEILSGSTVSSNYSWDTGVPFSSGVATVPAYSTTNYISGYAPGLRVRFKNNSITKTSSEFYNVDSVSYIWNFGDYYNDSGNVISLSCTTPVEHIFIMPGRYTINLSQNATVTQTTVDAPTDLCLDKYNLGWYWDNLRCSQIDAKTWNQTSCGSSYAKWWDSELACFQKYCKFWTWEKLRCVEIENRVRWDQTILGAQYQKRWLFEINDTVCAIPDIITTTSTNQQIVTKQYIVEVKEIIPKAALHSITQPTTGISPHSIRLTARATIPGSFPIDRIDWDFGDGSSIKTVIRQGDNNNDSDLIYNNIFIDDSRDPRNYDVTHTYFRNNEIYSMFYPSITAYSANTGTFDSCSTFIGPISLPSISSSAIEFTKIKNTPNGILYTATYDNMCTFFTTTTSETTNSLSKPNIPINRLQNSFGIPILYTGNKGTNYPPIITTNC